MSHPNGELYRFLVQLSKEQNVKIEELARRTGCSRSTLYRYMKGISAIPLEVRRKLIRVLNMNRQQAKMFQKHLERNTVDPALLEAREELDRFAFEGAVPDDGDIPLIFYRQERFFRGIGELCESVLAQARQGDFSCEIRIINCVTPRILKHLGAFLQELFDAATVSSAEHLLTFVKQDYRQTVETFMGLVSVLPLAVYKNYTAHYRMAESSAQDLGLFQDVVLLQCHTREEGAPQTPNYWFSFAREGLSSCIQFDDPYLYTFLMDHYGRLKDCHRQTLCRSSGLNLYSAQLLELATGTDTFLLKPNNCYDKIPMEVYFSMRDRLYNQVGALLAGLQGGGGDYDEAIAYFFDLFQKRIQLTYENRHMDVYSREGLLELVRTGKITDHIEGLPPFDKSEVRMMLEYIRDRSADPKDPYTLYITDRPFFQNGLIMLVLQGKGVVMEFSQQLHQGVTNNILIESPEITAILTDYIQNHIPANYALSQDDATACLNQLIEMCREQPR